MTKISFTLVAYRGVRTEEFSFGSSPSENAIVSTNNINNSSNAISNISKGKKQKNVIRKEFVINANLPPGYSAAGVLADPTFICHLTDPKTNQFHVRRTNPLCEENDVDDDQDVGCGNKETSICAGAAALTGEDKVEKFLRESAVLAQENTVKTMNLVQMSPTHTFRSIKV